MNKPISLIIKETKIELANICNKSGLSPIILDLILQGIYSEVHTLAEKQTKEDENGYILKIKNQSNTSNEGDCYEQK